MRIKLELGLSIIAQRHILKFDFIYLNIGHSSIQQEEDSFHQQTGLIFKEETSEVLNLGHSIVWC
jgi:hypothetical protein